ncbi:MAG: hypothetical protein CMJ80_10870 [Planctomycetaceae bacterium]|nr:hypothetical protein [Planctomycetaceae bacterium]
MTSNPAWILILVGLLVVTIGVAWLLTPSIPWFGKMPGDIHIERDRFQFYFPVVTCLLISLAVTGIMSLIRYFSN